ncbi:MAG: gliding motility-associated C-terminal domain-containing protein [Flavobacteriales bacterium]
MAQNQALIWHFGNNCVLDFNTIPPAANTGLEFSSIGANEGTASISDENGEILFYSSGWDVWGSDNVQMPSFAEWPPSPLGIPLLGGGLSATNSAFIVPDPGNPDLFYLFGMAEEIGYNGLSQQLGLSGLSYVMVDMSLNNGNGDVEGDIQVVTDQTTEKLAATTHCNGIDTWVVVHKFGTNEFYAYLITAVGIQPPVISSVGYAHDCPIGQMKISPDGKKIAAATYGFFSLASNVTFEVLDFDNSTGIVSNSNFFDNDFDTDPSNNVNGLYGVAFSPDSKKVYTGLLNDPMIGPSKIIQYDLELNPADIIANRQVVAEVNALLGCFQLAPDCKIYINQGDDDALATIDFPNEAGVACGYNPDGLIFPEPFAQPSLSLPAFNDSWFYNICIELPLEEDRFILASDTCFGAATNFALNNSNGLDNITWSFGDPESTMNTSQLFEPTHTFTEAGNYTITVSYSIQCTSYEISRQIEIVNGQTLIVDFYLRSEVCSDSTSVGPELNSNFTPLGYFTSNGLGSLDSLTGFFNPSIEDFGTYEVFYFAEDSICGSTASDSQSIEITDCSIQPISGEQCEIYIPNAFTPDQDGINEFLFAKSNCTPDIFEMSIFNRWGDLIFSSNDIDQAWTGGEDQFYAQDGIYPYLVNYSFDGLEVREKKGWICILR